MTFVNLAPNGTVANTGAVTGAANAHSALSDSSGSSYVTFDPNELVSLNVADLSLPSGGLVVLAQVYARVIGGASSARTTLVAGSQSGDHYTIVNWLAATDVAGASVFGGLSDSDVDGATMAFVHAGPSSADVLTVYEMWLRVLYLTKPTVSVTEPTSTVSENVVTVRWNPSFDADAQSDQYYREVKIFSSAQYGAGGFDPDSSTATAASGVELGRFASREFPSTVLPDGDYRAYVRVAASNTPDHWSDWDYEAFTVDAPNPGVPDMTLTADSSNGRIGIELDDTAGDVSTTHFQVERADDGTNFVEVRTELGDGLVDASGAPVTIYDYEAPNGTTVTYRARAYNSSTPSYSAWDTDTASWESGAEWLKCLLDPSLNVSLVVRSYPAFEVPANQTVFRSLGSSKGVAVSDVPGPEQGQLVVFTKSEADRQDLAALLELGCPVLLQVPGHPDRIVSFGDRGSTRIVDTASQEWHEETLPWTVVERPDGPLVS